MDFFAASPCYLVVKDLDESYKFLYEMNTNIYTSQNLHDVVLCTKYGHSIYSHKTILYGISKYFKNLFENASKGLETVYCVSNQKN